MYTFIYIAYTLYKRTVYSVQQILLYYMYNNAYIIYGYVIYDIYLFFCQILRCVYQIYKSIRFCWNLQKLKKIHIPGEKFFWKVFGIWPRPRSSSWWWRWRRRKRATLRFTISTSHWSTGSLSVLYQKKEERVLRTPRRDSERQRQDSERQRQDAGRMCFCLSNMIELTMFVPWSATLCSRRIGLNWYEKWK